MTDSFYEITRVATYAGGHAADPGYMAVRANGHDREFLFYCNPDGSNVRRIVSRPTNIMRRVAADVNFRRLSAANEAKRANGLERAVKQHLNNPLPIGNTAPHGALTDFISAED